MIIVQFMGVGLIFQFYYFKNLIDNGFFELIISFFFFFKVVEVSLRYLKLIEI